MQAIRKGLALAAACAVAAMTIVSPARADVVNTPLYSLIRSMPESSWAKANQNRFADAWVPPSLRPLYEYDTNPTPNKIIESWSSFAWDTNRGDIILFGGGHHNYSSNEVYRWRSSTLRWEAASLPSEIKFLTWNAYTAIDGPDAAPASAHTYDNNTYLPVLDRFLTFGGAAYQTGGAWYRWTDGTQTALRTTGPYLWDPNRADGGKVGGTTGSHVQRSGSNPGIVGGNMWENRDLLTLWGSAGPREHVNGCVQTTVENGIDAVYIAGRRNYASVLDLFRWTVGATPDDDQWSMMGQFWSGATGQTTCGLWPERKLFVYSSAGSNILYFWDLTTPSASNKNQAISNVGLEALQSYLVSNAYTIGACALKFDPIRQDFLLWCGNATLWRIVPPATNVPTGWSAQRVDGGGTAPVRTIGSGILGKWKYAPGFDVFVGVMDAIDGSVWVYKPAGWIDPGQGNPPPNQPPTVSASANPTSASTGQSITFTATAADADGSIVAIDWLFGDGGAASGAVVTHAFAAAGSYSAQVSVRDNGGLTASATAIVTVTDPSQDTTVTLQQGQNGYIGTTDTFLDNYYKTLVHGSSGAMLVDRDNYAPLVRFAVFAAEGGPVPNSATIVSAQLSLYKARPYDHTYNLRPLLVPWSQQQATWNQRSAGVPWTTPGALGAGSDVSATTDAAATGSFNLGWVSFDVTSRLQQWSTAIGAPPNYGWRVTFVSGHYNYTYFDTSEFATDATLRPKLVVVYRPSGNPPPNQPPTVSASANPTSASTGQSITFTATAADADGSIVAIDWLFGDGGAASGAVVTHAFAAAGSYSAQVSVRDNGGLTASATAIVTVTDPSQDTTVTLQQGQNGYLGTTDTYLDNYSKTLVHGSSSMMLVDRDNYAPLVRFAVFAAEGGPVPNSATIVSAQLSLYKARAYDHTYNLRPLLVPWSQQQATWNQRSAGVPWTTPGALGAGSDVSATTDAAATGSFNLGWVSFDVTSRLQQWSTAAASGAPPNYGWRVTFVSGHYNYTYFDTSEFATDATLRPKLMIVYH